MSAPTEQARGRVSTDCQCYACMAPDPRTEAQAFIAYVHGRGGFWDAHSQGKLAALEGRDRSTNPFSLSHAYAHEWLRAFDSVVRA